MKTQTMTISDFMNGDFKKEKKKRQKEIGRIVKRTGTTIVIPLIAAKPAMAAGTIDAVPVGAKQYIGESTLEIIAHALDPLVDLMVALSFPIASVVIIGSCFFFMFGKGERAWSGIQNAGLGYILIQIMPMLLKVLKDIGSAI